MNPPGQGRALPPVPGSEVDFLLPTGLMVTVNATLDTSLRQLKDRLYQEAKKYPLFSMLKDQGFYNFLGKLYISTHRIRAVIAASLHVFQASLGTERRKSL